MHSSALILSPPAIVGGHSESLKTVQELLGHEDITTTGNTYAHVMPEIKKQAASNLNSMLTRKKASPKGEATQELLSL